MEVHIIEIKELKQYYTIGGTYTYNGEILTLVEKRNSDCTGCPSAGAKCDGNRLTFKPHTPWRCQFRGVKIAYERVINASSNCRW